MKQPKVLHSDKWYDLVDIDGHVGLKSKAMTVSVLPFTVNENGLIEEIGVLKEHNKFREGDYCDTLITGTVEFEDDSLLFTAKRELLEEAGIDMTEEETGKWVFLGTIYLSKDCDKVIPIFGVDVTGKDINKPQGDGSEKEKLAEFSLTSVGEGLSSDEGLVLAAFLRLFNYMYAKSMNYV
jgi:8-oxo-dGTP pyrophosphatase MutT (NUDIX family)